MPSIAGNGNSSSNELMFVIYLYNPLDFALIGVYFVWSCIVVMNTVILM